MDLGDWGVLAFRGFRDLGHLGFRGFKGLGFRN